MAEDLNDDWWEEPTGAQQSKRARQDIEEEEEDAVDEVADAPAAKAKGREVARKEAVPKSASDQKIKTKKKGKKSAVNPAVEARAVLHESRGAADAFWAAFVKGLGGTLSSVELDDLKVDEAHFQQPEHTYNGDCNTIGDFLVKACPDAFKPETKLRKRHPRILVVCSSAIRGCDLIRGMGTARGGMIGKFFAKHMKLEQQTKFLAQKEFRIAIGTPGRLATLMAADPCLSLDDVMLVVLDYSYVDAKNRNLFQVPEVCRDLVPLLQSRILPSAIGGPSRLALF